MHFFLGAQEDAFIIVIKHKINTSYFLGYF